ncbi:MAG: 50S ribosomal protein L25/general stress protein Ctc [Candidatus Fischerbacteria bacterium RBG_13_37_8]|uniref:Large ribosomal subunit protein bL25 n=1 Tax=Candidatus Fischerbacteria bacterium RBG_13_37_8 TaxID=1817863 RepID=A0A1F5V8J8_9BACT|nr:MAG: 50S ribosomal protein L25/general stress protein Ctc [Candidatus Fischerbacteria bacterium RBG_13_37_8]
MHYQINVTAREQTGKGFCRKLRAKGLMPGVIYGHGMETIPVSINFKEFMDILRKAGETSIIELNINNKEPVNALIKEYQLNPIYGNVTHVDFYAVRADEIVTLSIPIHIIGDPIGVKQNGGILEIIMRELEIECLPTDIPEKLEIDVSQMNIGDEIVVSDVHFSEKVKILNKSDSAIALVSAPAVEEVAPVEVAETPAEPEVIKKGKETQASKEEEEE